VGLGVRGARLVEETYLLEEIGGPMGDVRYICLSDLHFGAQNSLLTNLDGVEADPTAPSATLRDLVDCLEALVAANEDQSVKPDLILNGDAVDFALASDEIAVMAFEQFVRLAFVDRDLFSHRVHYVPGNHDHHLWETARERQYTRYLSRRPPGERLAPPWHATSMLPVGDEKVQQARAVDAELLECVMRRFPPLAEAAVEVHYPNLGFRSPQGRSVVFHHGHYIDGIYLLMSRLKGSLFPASQPSLTPWGLESENFAWIDFFWSTLGRSGDWGADVTLLYDMLQDDAAVRVLADNLAATALAGGTLKQFPPGLRRWLSGLVASRLAGRLNRVERHAPSRGPLSQRGQAGLAAYVAGPLVHQFQRECPQALLEPVTFSFGHTHKPFAATQRFDGYRLPVDVYNTGGWVVDSLDANPMQGAAAVLFDAELNAASLRLFDLRRGAGTNGIRVETASDTLDNPLAARLQEVVKAESEPWCGFTAHLGDEIPRRLDVLNALIAQGLAAAKARPAAAAPRGS
jgi:hypothetical protein